MARKKRPPMDPALLELLGKHGTVSEELADLPEGAIDDALEAGILREMGWGATESEPDIKKMRVFKGDPTVVAKFLRLQRRRRLDKSLASSNEKKRRNAQAGYAKYGAAAAEIIRAHPQLAGPRKGGALAAAVQKRLGSKVSLRTIRRALFPQK